MKTNPVWPACFLLACGFAPLAISGAGGQEPDSPEARRKALEAERRKATRRMAEIDVELEKLKSAGKPGDVAAIEGFLGISADFSVYAKWEAADGLVFAELDTNKKLPAPAWDRDWGSPRAVLFGAGFCRRARWERDSENQVWAAGLHPCRLRESLFEQNTRTRTKFPRTKFGCDSGR